MIAGMAGADEAPVAPVAGKALAHRVHGVEGWLLDIKIGAMEMDDLRVRRDSLSYPRVPRCLS